MNNLFDTTPMTMATDSYKIGHWNMMPQGTTRVYSYFEARTGAKYNNVVFFGLQYYLQKYLSEPITNNDIDFAEQVCRAHFGTDALFNRKMWQRVLDKHGGFLPVKIKAVPEGSVIPVSNVLLTVENTDDECYQLTNHLETMLSRLWYPSTVATLSYELKKLIAHYYNETVANEDQIWLDFALHDFGYRGVSSEESAMLGGMAHLLNFKGTDTLAALFGALKYYEANPKTLGFSVPATEHSIMTSRGREGEQETIADLLQKYPNGILSMVIDSFNYRDFITTCGTVFKENILSRDGKVVFRPDSGDPISVSLEVVESLGALFGFTVNAKGYKVLNPKVGALWGDGIDYIGVRNILHNLRANGWAANNIVFGMGGNLLQKGNDRDTMRFAFKSSAQQRNGVWYDIKKDPLDSSKKSKSGRLYLSKMDGNYETLRNRNPEGGDHALDELRLVYCNGSIYSVDNFEAIRGRVK